MLVAGLGDPVLEADRVTLSMWPPCRSQLWLVWNHSPHRGRVTTHQGHSPLPVHKLLPGGPASGLFTCVSCRDIRADKSLRGPTPCPTCPPEPPAPGDLGGGAGRLGGRGRGRLCSEAPPCGIWAPPLLWNPAASGQPLLTLQENRAHKKYYSSPSGLWPGSSLSEGRSAGSGEGPRRGGWVWCEENVSQAGKRGSGSAVEGV